MIDMVLFSFYIASWRFGERSMMEKKAMMSQTDSTVGPAILRRLYLDGGESFSMGWI